MAHRHSHALKGEIRRNPVQGLHALHNVQLEDMEGLYALNVCAPNVQVENVKKGFPYIMFGDGHLASCKPISEADLASFMADCIEDEQKINQVLPIGGM